MFQRTAMVVRGLYVGALFSGCGSQEPPPSQPAPAPAPTEEAPPPAPPEALAINALGPLAPTPQMGWPVEVVHITSDFGWRVDPVSGRGTRLHAGTDFRGAIGTPVLSVAAGVVAFAGHDALLGNHVIIDHGQTVRSYYGHMSSLLVHEGVGVERGAAIGLVGNTGRSAAPHLHLTIKVAGAAVDPVGLIGHPLHAPTALTPAPLPTESEPVAAP